MSERIQVGFYMSKLLKDKVEDVVKDAQNKGLSHTISSFIESALIEKLKSLNIDMSDFDI